MYRRTHVTKCNNLLSFCCISTVALCLFDSNLPGMDCLDGLGTWAIVPDHPGMIGLCMVNDALNSIG